MDELWENWLSDLEMEECHLFSENDLNSLEKELEGENPLQPALSCETHSPYSNFSAESTSVLNVAAAAATSNTMGNSSLEEEIGGFDNGNLKQHATSEKPLFSSSTPYILSFEDSTATAMPNIPKKTCHNHGAKSKGSQEISDIRKSKRDRSSSQIQDHIMAERKRRENLTRMFIALSATIPGLTKIDKVSVLNKAIDYVKVLQGRVKELEEQNKRRKTESVVSFNDNKPNVAATDDLSCFPRNMKSFHNVEASVSTKDVLIRVVCEKQHDIVPKLLAKLEANNLSVVCSSALPFGSSILNITVIAQMDPDFNKTMDDLVKILNEELLEGSTGHQL